MLPGQSALLGIGLLLTGLVFVLLVGALLRFLPRLRPPQASTARLPVAVDLPLHNHAILVVRSGGRVEYVNPTAQGWFELRQEEQPNLEALARRIQPGEDLLKLCAAEGWARFSLNGRPLEGVSYQLPGQPPAMLVSLQRPNLPSSLAAEGEDTYGPMLGILTEFSQAVAAKSGLPATLKAILENVERLIPADLLEIKVWNAEEGRLLPYYLRPGPGGERRLETDISLLPAGYTAHLVEKRQAFFIPDCQTYAEIPCQTQGQMKPIRSYIGLPLLAGGELTGTLEAGLTTDESYTSTDLEILQFIAGQACTAIRNAVILEAEHQQTAESGGLADLARAISSARELKELFGQLVQSIAPLFEVEILGFLIYNENRLALEAQAPFIGLPAQFIELYRVPIPTDSPAEGYLLKQDLLATQNAAEDERWRELGFQDLARAASMRETVLVPLVSAGRSLGYLQASNHRQPETPFSNQEIRRLNIVANQAAAIIDNVTLVQQSRQRALRSEALWRIASLASSSANLDEVLRYALQVLARLLQADMAAVFLLEEPSGVLRLHVGSLWGVSSEIAEPLSRLFVDEPQLRSTVFGSRRAFLSGHLSKDKRVLAVYRPLIEKLGVESCMVVPLVVQERGIGELMIGSRKLHFFDNYDLQVVSTAASQLAVAVEGATLMAQTDESLRRRIDHLTALNRISRELNSALELDRILQVVYDECLRTTHADCGEILLIDENVHAGAEPRITSYAGEAPGDRLLPLEKAMLEHGKPILVSNFSQSEYPPAHDGIQSALIVPVAYQEKTSGLIHLHSRSPDHFDETAVEIIQSLAVQTAIARDNILRAQEQRRQSELLRRRADSLAKLFETTRNLPAEGPLEASLESLAGAIQEATPFQMVLISIIEAETGLQRRITGVGIPPETLKKLKAHQQPWFELERLLRPEFRVGKAYFIPHDQSPVVSAEIEFSTLLAEQTTHSPNAWHPDDALIFPLHDSQGKPIGLISLAAPRDGLRPDPAALETVETFAAQVALTIQSSRLLSGYSAQVETLASSLKRQEQLLSASQSHLPLFLHKDLEQMIAIRNLERRASRIRAGMEIIESIHRQVDAQSALLALGREMLTRLAMSISIVAEKTSEGPRLVQILGSVPPGVNVEALFGQRNPLRHCLQTGEALLVMNLEEDDTWQDTPLLTSLRAKGFVCLPILLDNEPVAAILALDLEPLPALSDEDRGIYFQIARQVSTILQNIRLLNLTRDRLREVNLLLDFSRQLSGLDADGILATLLDNALRVVANAHAGAVLLWNEQESVLVPRVAQNYANNDSLMKITYRLGEALPGQTFQQKQPRRVAEVDFARDYKLPAEKLLRYREASAGRLPVSSLLLPIQAGERALGVLVLDNFNTSAAFTAEDETLLLALTRQVALSLENVRLFAETRRLADRLEQRVAERTAELAREKHNTETLLRVLSEVSASLDLNQTLNRTLALLNEVTGAQQGSVLLLNAEDNSIHYRAGYGYKMPRTSGLTKPTALKIDEGVAGWVIKNREAVLISDVRKDTRWVELPLKSSYQRSVIAAPLVVGEEVIGVIMAFHRHVAYFTPENMQLVQAIGSQVAVAINNAQLYGLIRDQAEHLGNMLRSQQVEASRQQAILEAVADGVLVTDANNEINFINSSTKRILGLQAEMTVGQSLENFGGMFGKTTQTWTHTIRSWSEDPTSYHQGDTYAEQLILENGSVVLVHLAPVIWHDEFLGTVSIFRDITHEVEVDRLKSEFVATVSHELRTPMTSIKGYVDLLLMGASGTLDEKQTHFLEIVRSSTERLNILVNDLLDISRIEVGRVSLSLQPIDLREVVEDVMVEALHRSQTENKPMGLSLDAPPDLPRVYGDLERVHQILGNLVDNALHYTPENGRISIRLQTVDGEVQVDVVDNGIGILPALQDRVFERFFRGEDPLVLATPGTGLGLSIVKQLVNMHKGRIWITSTGAPGEGSTFSFTLPLYQAKE
ncbi:MAG: GAF domain-containing protein [Anaerolineales bacterium]|nr:GAF domain-containing protein [Anaerolineales bacterium]